MRVNASRLFFAVWPSADVAASLAAQSRDAQSACGGRATLRPDLHLTLAFLGELTADRVAAAVAAADTVQATAFDLMLDRVGYWKHNRILWAGCGIVPPPLAALAEALATQLRGAGFVLEARVFAAHVTLLRNARCTVLPQLERPLGWRVGEFVLAESRQGQGARYAAIHRWRLAPPF